MTTSESPFDQAREILLLGSLRILQQHEKYDQIIHLVEEICWSWSSPARMDVTSLVIRGNIVSHASYAAYRLGRYQDAYKFASLEIQMAQAEPEESLDLARGFNGRAVAQERLGHLRQSISDYHDALKVLDRQRVLSSYGKALRDSIRLNLADLQITRGSFQRDVEALPFFEAVSPAYEYPGPSEHEIILMLNGRGAVLLNVGDANAAVAVLEQARAAAETSSSQELIGIVISNLSAASWALGDSERAIDLAIEARNMHRSVGSELALATDCYILGVMYRWTDKFKESVECFREAWIVAKTASPRSLLALRILNGLAGIRLWQGDVDRAQAAAERALEIYEGIRPDIGLAEEEHREALRIYRDLIQIRLGISVHRKWIDEVVSLIERSKARFWFETITALGLPHVQPGNVAETDPVLRAAWSVQQELRFLNWRDCLVLDFFVGPVATYLAYGMNGTFSAYRIDINEWELSELVEAFRNELLRSASRRGNQANAAKELSETLFGQRAFPFDRAASILVLPDGPLWTVPFDALPGPGLAALADVAPIFLSPSIPVLEAIRHRSAGGIPIQEWLPVVVADPAPQAVIPIPGTRDQLEVVRVIMRQTLPGVFAAGNEATKQIVLPAMERATHIHIASHAFGEINDATSYIVLSDGNGGVDRLEPNEISGLRLKAKLVFLSACNTSIGQESVGEGLMSLVRAFLLAGASCVIGTLWPIADQGAVDLIRLFYSALISGESAARAMYLARAELRRAGAQPRLWAGPQVIGDGDASGQVFLLPGRLLEKG